MTLRNVKRGLVKGMRRDIARAKQLFETLAVNGMRFDAVANTPHKLRQTDKRDAAQFIFFEIAAKYEAFVVEAFEIEVRKCVGVSAVRVPYVIGNIDRGLTGVMGWGTPETVRDRGRNLFGKTGFFARLESKIGQQTYQRLGYAHTVRNRIAHDSGNAVTKYRKALSSLGVPPTSRKGLSVGRLLLEYPKAASADDRWFYRFLASYEQVVNKFNSSVRVPKA